MSRLERYLTRDLMRVTRETRDQLIIEDNPLAMGTIGVVFCALIFIGGVLLAPYDLEQGIGLILVSLTLAWVAGLHRMRKSQLILDRANNHVELRWRSLVRYRRMYWRLEDLTNATLQTKMFRSDPWYRVALVFEDGMDPGTFEITHRYFDEHNAGRAKDIINTWIAQVDSGAADA